LSGRGGFVIYDENGMSVCRGATPEEARELRKRDPNIPLHALSPISAKASESAEAAQGGLKIILRATPQLESNSAAKAAFLRAAAAWEAIIRSPITVVIDVDYGLTRFGEQFPSSVLGSTDPQEYGTGNSYPEIRNKLVAGASSEQELSLYNSLPFASVPTDLGPTANVFTPTATLRALGILKPIADPDGERGVLDFPPSIGFNSAFQFDFDSSDGVDSDKRDFETTATHEIGHALGFTSLVGERELEPTVPLFISIWDLFRFRPGTTLSTIPTALRILSSGGEARFFAGGPELALSTGRIKGSVGGDGQQASHWKDDLVTGQHIGIMDPTLEQGAHYTISVNDRAALNLFGYQLAAEPREAKIGASDLTGGARFGSGVGISGDTAVVGNPFSPGPLGNNSPGAAYIFARNGDGAWIQQAKLVPSDTQSADRFGNGVAISGDTVVVGAFSDNIGANTDQGSAYIFVRNGTTWTQQAKLVANDGAASDQFGFKVGISGDTVIISSLRSDVGAVTDKGAAYVFVRNGTTWTQQQKLSASDGAANDLFGIDVSISGDNIIVGSYLDDEGAKVNQGAAYVFVRNETTWTQQQKLTPGDGVGGEGFGYKVAIDGGTAVIGKLTGIPLLGHAVQGAAYVFVRNGTTWTQQQKLVGSGGVTNNAFGESVAISNNRVVVGVHGDNIGTLSNAGSAYVFVRKDTIWSEVQKLTASDADGGDDFGVDVAIAGNAAIIGAAHDGNLGSTYIYSPLLAPPTVQKTGVFRPLTGELFLKNENSSGFADTHIIFGNPIDYPLAGDWNGDGIASVGIYRNGVFYLRNTNSTGFADIVIPFGSPGDQPIAGDWNGDGVDTVGVYRNGTFLLRNSNTAGPPDLVFTLGNPGDVGIAGDWNGDGIVTCGVFRPSNGIVYLRNSNTTGFADRSFVFGNAGDKPVAGDWNGDGIDTIGIYRDGVFYLSNSNATGFADIVFVLGNNGDFPIAGNWNGQP
jgi:hypothetical protein